MTFGSSTDADECGLLKKTPLRRSGLRVGSSDGNSSRNYANQIPGSGFSPGTGSLKSMSTQPESLILAQSERWRQA